MKILSLFAGAGGLDSGFERAGFDVAWANEKDSKIWETFEHNFPHVSLDKRDIRDVPSEDMPDDIVGVVGGPPCQSWSEAGARRGIEDDRGKLFFQYIRVLRDKQPLFFMAENVQGMLFKRNAEALDNILFQFDAAGYDVQYQLLNTVDYAVPQDRKRVIFVGYHKSLGLQYKFPEPIASKLDLRNAIWDLRETSWAAKEKNYTNGDALEIANHEYMTGGYSSIYMSRNRVRTWDEPSFTIQAGGRHAPIHPQANVMLKVEKDLFKFDPASVHPYRRLSVREAARIQTFPDDFIFKYDRVADGYKMVGNAVPVIFAYHLAHKIYADMYPVVMQSANIQEPVLDEVM